MSTDINVLINASSAAAYLAVDKAIQGSATTKKTSNDGSTPEMVVMAKEVDNEQIMLEVEGVSYLFGGTALEDGYFSGTPPLIKYSRTKKMIVTEVGNDGDEVIEEWGMKAYELSISGLLVSADHVNYPKEKIETIRKIFEGKTAKVRGEVFRSLNINEIYISEMSLHGIIGYTDTWEYSLKARSMHPISFTLSE